MNAALMANNLIKIIVDVKKAQNIEFHTPIGLSSLLIANLLKFQEEVHPLTVKPLLYPMLLSIKTLNLVNVQ